MTTEKNAWMIESGDVVEVMSPHRQPPAPMEFDRPGDALARAALVRPARRRMWRIPSARSGLRFAPLVCLTYVLGPLAIVLTPSGRREKLTVMFAGLSYAATVVLVAFHFGQIVRVSVWLWGGLVALAVVGGFSVWARAVHLLGGEGLAPRQKLPRWLRRDWVVSVLGLVAPGSGFLLGGRADRAAVALWSLCPAVLCAVVLLNAGGLWHHHYLNGWLAHAGPWLESCFLVAAGSVALGFLVYIAQALEGMRQVLVEPGLQRRRHNDAYAVAVIAVVIAVVVMVRPDRMAAQIGAVGTVLQAEGMQVIPLRLAETAHQLSPDEPVYSVRVMELCAALGRREQADRVRGDLARYYGALYRVREAVTDSSRSP